MKPPTRQDSQFTSFRPVRLIITGIVGILATVLGMVLGFFGGGLLDAALGYPMGRSDGFIQMGLMNVAFLVVATPIGAVIGTLASHRWLDGEGAFWVSIVAVILAIGAVCLLSLPQGGLAFPTLALLPIASAVGLEISHVLSD